MCTGWYRTGERRGEKGMASTEARGFLLSGRDVCHVNPDRRKPAQTGREPDQTGVDTSKAPQKFNRHPLIYLIRLAFPL